MELLRRIVQPSRTVLAGSLPTSRVPRPIWIAGVWLFLARPPRREYRIFGWAFLALLAFFLVQRAKPYYLTPFYPVLLAGGAILIERLSAGRPVARAACVAALAIGGAALAPLAKSVTQVPAGERWNAIRPES